MAILKINTDLKNLHHHISKSMRKLNQLKQHNAKAKTDKEANKKEQSPEQSHRCVITQNTTLPWNGRWMAFSVNVAKSTGHPYVDKNESWAIPHIKHKKTKAEGFKSKYERKNRRAFKWKQRPTSWL